MGSLRPILTSAGELSILRSLSCKLRSIEQTYGGLQLGYASKSLVAIFPHISDSAAVLKFLFLKPANKVDQPPFFGLRLGHAVMEHNSPCGGEAHLRGLLVPGKMLLYTGIAM